MKLREILRTKGTEVATISGNRTVLDAVQALVDRNIGSLVVTRDDRPVGIITERDVLRLSARAPGELDTIEVGDVMSRDLVTATPDDELQAMMTVMTENRIRHLPVMEGGRLAGLVSIGDLLNACRVEAEQENTHLRRYIQGAGS